MRAISLWQPWASLWLSPAKIHETRHWPTNIRGWVAVHAAKKRVGVDDELNAVLEKHYPYKDGGRNLAYGAIIGMVNIVDCQRTDDIYPLADLAGRTWKYPDDFLCGDFSAGRFGWKRDDAYVRLDKPIPWKGLQGFFNVPISEPT